MILKRMQNSLIFRK